MRLSERPKCPSTVSTTRRTMTSALHSNWRLLHRMESSKRLKAKNMILSWDYSSIPKTHLNSTNLQEKLWKHSSILRKKVRLNNQSYLFILGGSRESVIPFSVNIYKGESACLNQSLESLHISQVKDSRCPRHISMPSTIRTVYRWYLPKHWTLRK